MDLIESGSSHGYILMNLGTQLFYPKRTKSRLGRFQLAYIDLTPLIGTVIVCIEGHIIIVEGIDLLTTHLYRCETQRWFIVTHFQTQLRLLEMLRKRRSEVHVYGAERS